MDKHADVCGLDDLQGEGAERCGCGARVRRGEHVEGGVRAQGADGLTPGIPASMERGESRLVTGCLVSRPPGPELVVPTLAVAGTADTAREPHDGSRSMDAHDDLLWACCQLLGCAA